MEKKYWYEYYHEWCVVCGKESVEKYRVYDRPKPENYADRHHEKEIVCWSHF